MLPLDLLRVKRRGDQIKPDYLLDIWPASRIIEAYKPGVKLGDARANVEESGLPPKLARGLAHLAEKFIAVEEVNKRLLTRVRLEIFREAAKAHPVVDEALRQRIIRAVAERLRLSEAEVEGALRKIHEDELAIVSAPSITPQELVALYNTSLIQTLLFRSIRASFYVKASGSTVKEIARGVKRLGLMYIARRAGEGIWIDAEGPATVLRQTERYGTRFAKLVPYVISADDWRIEAEIALRGRTYKFVESKSTAPPLSRRDIEPVSFDSSAEQEFYARISPMCSIEREPEALVIEGRLFIPDFKIGDLYVEIVGFWTPEYLARKYEKLSSAKVPFLVLVDERLALSTWRSLPHYVVLYKERPRLSDVFKYIKPYCRPPQPRAP